jgi:protocatechuate 3,4-dioxygenase beta subunit
VVRDAATRKPLPGVTIELQAPTYTRAVTDRDGRFRIPGLPAGECRLLPKMDGYELGFIKPGAVATGETISLDIPLRQAGTLHIHVVDGSGQPVMGRIWFHVLARSAKGTSTLGTEVDLDGDGHAIYRGLAPGLHDLMVSTADARSETKSVHVRPGETTVRFELPSAPGSQQDQGPAAIRGTVIDADTRQPIPGARVRVPSLARAQAYTDAKGAYALRSLAEGNYKLYVSKDGYGFHVVGNVKVQEGSETVLDLELQPAATVRLRVVDRSGDPVAGQFILSIRPIGSGGGTRIGTNLQAGADGRATYRQIVPGRYALAVHVAGRGEGRVEAEIRPGENDVEVRLK